MNTMLDDKQKAAMDAGVQFGMQMLKQLPKGDSLALEAHMTGVLIAFWGALWGTFGTAYARGFIEAQLRGMEPDVPPQLCVVFDGDHTENHTIRRTIRCKPNKR